MDYSRNDGTKDSIKGWKGSVTVFLSLICVLVLAVICTAVESARIQGARAQTANITGMGNFSVLGEFEKELLDQYEIFALDASYGTGSFSVSKVNDHLKTFLRYNARPKEGVFSVGCLDPWNLELADSRIVEYALLTDQNGEPFYQQAVAFMKTNLGAEVLQKVLSYQTDTEEILQSQEEYKRKKKENARALEAAEQDRDEMLQELQENDPGSAETMERTAPRQKNPLKEIAKLSRRSLLDTVTGNAQVSSRSIGIWSLPSRRRSKKGTMKLEQPHGGITSDLLFREYLLNYFPNYTDSDSTGALSYQAEYLIGGGAQDQKNLKDTVNRLLLIREGMNYLYCVSDSSMSSQAGGLATALTGFFGIPALTAATKHALLLAWAYGESLIDVRTLLAGGRIPLRKDPSSWVLTLENLGRLSELLTEELRGSAQGMEYRDYLRILLSLSPISRQKMRALDLIQVNLGTSERASGFLAENCMVGIKSSTKWNLRPVFFSFAQAAAGIRGQDIAVTQTGSMAYE